MYIPRLLNEPIKDKIINYRKIIILYGPRQVGKTTLIKKILNEIPGKLLQISADEKKYAEALSSQDLAKLSSLVSGYDLVFIDEAQRVPDIGINLKILNDNLPNLKLIVTGSSSLDLANKIKEPLTGRTWTYNLFPVSSQELLAMYNPFELKDNLEEQLIYGNYPEIFSIKNKDDKYQYLTELTSSYLYKDILELSSIKHSTKLHSLLRLLAFQVGSLVSMSELASNLGMAKDTVESYIDLLEKSFVLFRLSGFSKNLRKEITKMDKIYFYDLGVRNIIIDNLNSLEYREDHGKLWENFLLIERKKKLHYSGKFPNVYYWRTYTGAELDYIEQSHGSLSGYEFKYSKAGKKPKTWGQIYPESKYQCINKENYLDFLT